MENIAFAVIYVVLGIAGLVSSGFFLYGLVGYIVNRKKKYQDIMLYSFVVILVVIGGWVIASSDPGGPVRIPNSVMKNNLENLSTTSY